MPMFVCDKCHVIENTSSGHFWGRNIKFSDIPEEDHGKALCQDCLPKDHWKSGRRKQQEEKPYMDDKRLAEITDKTLADHFIYIPEELLKKMEKLRSSAPAKGSV